MCAAGLAALAAQPALLLPITCRAAAPARSAAVHLAGMQTIQPDLASLWDRASAGLLAGGLLAGLLALDPPRRAGALGCRRAPRRLCLVALATPRPVCSSPRPNLALGASRTPLSYSLRPKQPPQPAVAAAPAWMLHQAQLLLALCHVCQHRACLLAPCGCQRPQSSVLTSLSPLRHVRTCLAAVGDVSWVQVLAKA